MIPYRVFVTAFHNCNLSQICADVNHFSGEERRNGVAFGHHNSVTHNFFNRLHNSTNYVNKCNYSTRYRVDLGGADAYFDCMVDII